MPELLLPDYLGSFQRGQQFKRQNTLADMGVEREQRRMASDQKLQSTLAELPNVSPENRRQFATGLAAQGDAGMRAANDLQGMWSSWSAEDQARELQKAHMVGKSLKAVQDDPERYQAVRDEILRIAPKAGESLPEEWDDRTSAIVDAYIQRIDGFGRPAATPSRLAGFEGLASAAGLEPGSDDYRSAARRDLGLEAKAGTRTREERLANDTELAGRVADTQADITEAKEFAKLTGSSRAKAIDSADEEIRGLEKNIRNLDEAYQALADGAQSGPLVSKWTPTLREETQRLEAARNKLGLDVVGAVTFGSLSEGELDLALATALPNLPPKELMQWIRDRQGAQQKLIGYFDEQIQHLDGGGTVASFNRMKRKATENDSRGTTGFQEGQTATNPQTGEKIIFQNGQWQNAGQ